MTRPLTVTIASWIWISCALFTTFTIFSILTATDLLAFVTGPRGIGLSSTEGHLAAGEAIGRPGWLLATGLFVAMIVQLVAAVKLRDGARWSRTALSIAVAFSVLAVMYDMTLWTAWLLVVANAVAVALAESDSALDYLEAPKRRLISA
ncbi:hypothetical protein [Rhodococcus sp. IEGM 1408]|uniref:hypothetical protein n=1 Tax=Rhodococcus sp. IEGM 1408 TaxID=3082220 RepID=UPI002955A304|nr:hypothetical protein [Rhodococcus sp. IEGM 1408]MDV8003023.1 hypothetical protein [Rhodococcus sp. IEGM 1408]